MNTILEVKNVSKSFGGVAAVQRCSFEIERDKVTALIGPNGAGKTTLFNIINGFLPADTGEIIFQKQNITRLSAWRRSRAGLSRTFQLARLFHNLSVYQNLELAARPDDDLFWKIFVGGRRGGEHRTLIRETAEFVGLQKSLTAPITELSYGEQKLFDLCRALVNPHTLLLLDEPVAGLNPVMREKFKIALARLRESGESVLLIEHDMDFVRGVADRVIVMDQGAVLAEGEPREVLSRPEVLEAYLGVG